MTDKSVYGILLVMNGVLIEKVFRTIENAEKVFPSGSYPLKFEWSPSFDMNLWELKEITGRSEIKIHVANYPNQLKGCIGIGMAHVDINKDGEVDLGSSANALGMFHDLMEGQTESSIEVSNLI